MLDLLGGFDVAKIIGGIVALFGILFAVRRSGAKSEQRKQRIRNLEQEAEDREKLDGIRPSSKSDTVDRLRKPGGF